MKVISMKNSFFRQCMLMLTALLLMISVAGCGGSSGDGGPSSVPLTSPKNFVITPKNGKLDIAWTKIAAVNNVDASYEVWIGTTADNTQKLNTSITIAGNLVACSVDKLADGSALQNGTTYYVRLKAIYAGIGEASLSDALPGTPVSAPGAPDITSSTGYEEMLELVWDADATAVSYKVYWKQGASTSATPPSDAGVAVVSKPRTIIGNVANNVFYRVWVQSTNTAGDSAFAYADIMPQPAAAAPANPAAPTSDGFTASSSTLTVTWPAVSYAKSYVLKYSTSGTLGASASKAVSSKTTRTARADASSGEIAVAADSGSVKAVVTGLTNGTTYYFWVKAVNSKGESAYTSLGSAMPGSKSVTAPIDFTNLNFVLGEADAEYVFAEDVPASVFFPTGRTSDRLTRFRETALGNLFTDGAAWYVREKYENVDFVFLNGGYIEGAIAKGNITLSSLMAMIPSTSLEDKLVVLSLTGAQVIDLFRRAASVVHTGRGSSGTGAWGMVSEEINYTLQYRTLNPDALPANSTEQDLYRYGWIKDGTLKFNGQDIDPTKTYRIATTKYLADGGEGYVTFLNATNRVNHDEYFWQTIATYIYEMETISPYLDGRLKIIGGVPLKTPWEAGPVYVPGDLNWTPPYDNSTYMR